MAYRYVEAWRLQEVCALIRKEEKRANSLQCLHGLDNDRFHCRR